ncbi:MAG: DUF5625 family protein [bacterium]|jgi:hypothetical protein|nr:hypothetical protein [Rhodocyclaceae bacterium]MCA3166507.1 hypothetical protein [Burkholderiales bacterium]MCA3459173.1 hypothetical protein [Rhodobacter sp.]MCZ8081335.1 DUF5625 family protein [Paracoccaceae bacterium]MCA3054259.1 hypothetical protein [Rhodocyclaceae bacterium]
MSRSKYWQMPFGFVFFMTLASPVFSVGAAESAPQVPPIEIPFNTKKIGEKYTFEVNVVEQLTYAVDVRFYITLPNKWSHLFDKESPEENKQLFKILGGARKNESGEWVEPGVPIKFRVQILQGKTQEIILDKLVDHPGTAAAYMGRYATLAAKNLPAGVYTVRIEYLEGAAELASLHAKIWFARAHHGK